MALWRSSLATAFAVAAWVAPFASATPGPLPTKQPLTIRIISRDLANALTEAKTTRLVRFRRHRTPSAHGYQIYWIDLATGKRRALDYDASSHLKTGPSLSYYKAPYGEWNPSGACGCDLDPFTNFPGRTLNVLLLGDQMIDGQPTIHLRFTISGGPTRSRTDFWIDRSNHLPVRSKVVYGGILGNGQLEPTMSTTDEFTWLPRTIANLVQL